MDYVTYLRVSTQKQGQSGLGIEGQRAAIQDYIRQQGCRILAEHVEVESGKQDNRPALAQAVREANVEFIAVDLPFANRLTLHILAAWPRTRLPGSASARAWLCRPRSVVA